MPDVHPIYAERWPHWPGPLSTSLEQTRELVERHMAIQAKHGFSLWLVRDRATGAVVGDCGLQPLERRGPEVELGYRLGRRYWRRGLATEAARACLRVAFNELALEEIVAVTHPDNAASRRVMEKLGMSFQGKRRYYGGCVMYVLSRAATLPSAHNTS